MSAWRRALASHGARSSRASAPASQIEAACALCSRYVFNSFLNSWPALGMCCDVMPNTRQLQRVTTMHHRLQEARQQCSADAGHYSRGGLQRFAAFSTGCSDALRKSCLSTLRCTTHTSRPSDVRLCASTRLGLCQTVDCSSILRCLQRGCQYRLLACKCTGKRACIGWQVLAMEAIGRGMFVIEYTGELSRIPRCAF